MYERILDIGRDRENPIFLEVGAGCESSHPFFLSKPRVLTIGNLMLVGTDVRKLVSDGYPSQQVIATDLHAGINSCFPTSEVAAEPNTGLWNAGHELFKSNPEEFPIAFLTGDIFELTSPSLASQNSPLPSSLSHLKTLHPLNGRVSVIYATHFFHLFDIERTKLLAERFDKLLSPESGSFIYGLHLGAREATMQTSTAGTMFVHSPESWQELWYKVVDRKTTRVNAKVIEGYKQSAMAFGGEKPEAPTILLLVWSVERL